MNQIVINIYVLICLAIGWLFVGLIIGGVFAVVLSERAQNRTARYQRTGNPAGASSAAAVSAMPGGEFRGLSEEAIAQQKAYANVIERGADDFMQRNPGMDRGKARTLARQALAELGAFKNGAAGA